MSQTTASPELLARLPEEMRTAQEAMKLPEVQEMLRKLSDYNLGIYVPHMHDDDTGQFTPLPDGMTQVEDDLQVTFARDDDVVDEGERTYVPVGWAWSGGGMTSAMACKARCVMQGTMHTSGHDSTPDKPTGG
jgi:hypothetical protein